MKNTDPNYKNDLSFRSMDDSPENDGFNQKDFDEVDPRRFINDEKDDERENDTMEEYWESFGERFD